MTHNNTQENPIGYYYESGRYTFSDFINFIYDVCERELRETKEYFHDGSEIMEENLIF